MLAVAGYLLHFRPIACCDGKKVGAKSSEIQQSSAHQDQDNNKKSAVHHGCLRNRLPRHFEFLLSSSSSSCLLWFACFFYLLNEKFEINRVINHRKSEADH
jgi:hypothetical protein